MKGRIYTVEELMLDDGFVNYCLSKGSGVPSKWKSIIRDNPEQEEVFEEAKKMVQALRGGLSRPEINRQIEEVRRQLLQRDQDISTDSKTREPALSSTFIVTGKGEIRRKVFRSIALYASTACLLLVTAWLAFKQVKNLGERRATQPMSYQTPVGYRQAIELPDGSSVMLNSNSTVSWNSSFNDKNREILLKGDAFFKVAKNPDKPFIVVANNVSATALGTKFYVHGKQSGNKFLQVDLLEGKVKVANIGRNVQNEEMLLLPGESCTKNVRGNFEKNVFDTTWLRSWEANRISFNETPVLKALKQLERWFNVPILIKKQGLKDRLITGDYQSRSLQEILKVICFSINANHSFTENNVIIE